ncbi:predicted protein [Uncinocarpus reesii 1704]|uniref:Uncharacterized protein n=1 Tax=Uncinocarpus reesii (strain UAMH 1704) TaxID=336963 RepID=C4JNV1_UNCRE|nr:uncharacterized protein UREG_04421 [Uncinocarpus reesii 1704]EEP79575.1 predicted protein [Uncinocarpus reesii 1704]
MEVDPMSPSPEGNPARQSLASIHEFAASNTYPELQHPRALEPPGSHDYHPGHFTCPLFFQSLGDDSFRSESPGFHWQYELRREAQRILPFLYLGPTSAARNIAFLKEAGITCVLAIRSNHPSHEFTVNADKAAAAAGIESQHVKVEDYHELGRTFPQLVRLISNHVCRCRTHSASTLPAEKKVLVFCETGNERSASLVIAYLMVIYNIQMHTALGHVQGRRLCINIDFSMRQILLSFESILNAQRDVVRVSQSPGKCGIYVADGVKRPHAKYSEDDCDVEMGEAEKPAKRQNLDLSCNPGL